MPFATRVLEVTDRLLSLLPSDAPTLVAAVTHTTTLTNTAGVTVTVTIEDVPASLTPGSYTVKDLCQHLALAMIPLGLTNEKDRLLQHTLNHLDSEDASNSTTILKHLQCANTMSHNIAVAEDLSASALAANIKKNKSSFTCAYHKTNSTHNTKDCCVLAKKRENKEAAAKAATNFSSSTSLNSFEQATMANILHICLPPVCHPNNSPRPKTTADDPWNPDTGATSSMTKHLNWLRNIVNVKVAVELTNNSVVWATKMGKVWFQPAVHGCRTGRTIVFHNILYIPKLQNNLFSVLSVVQNAKWRVSIEEGEMRFYSPAPECQLVMTVSITGTTGHLEGWTLDNKVKAAFLSKHVSRDLLHQHLGHIGRDHLQHMLRHDLTYGIAIEPKSRLTDVCTSCLAGKQHRDPFPQSTENRSIELLGHIHSNFHGPLQTQTPGGFKYWITFVDGYSQFKVVCLLCNKSDAFEEFKKFVARVECQTGKKVKELWDDKGGEYIGKEFDMWCAKQGIAHQHTVRATPQQNGVTEHLNRTLAEGVVAMLNQSNLPKSFWGVAVLYLTDILNCTPSSTVANTTSWAIWYNKQLDISMFRVFGCHAHVNILRKDRKNLEPHFEPQIFIGFAEGYKGWKVYSLSTKKVSVTRDVVFDESSFPGLSTSAEPVPVPIPVMLHDIWLYDDKAPPPAAPVDSDSEEKSTEEESTDEDEDDEDDKVAKQLAPTTPER